MEYASADHRLLQSTDSDYGALPKQSKIANAEARNVFHKDTLSNHCSSPNTSTSHAEETTESNQVPTIRLNDHRIPMHSMPIASNPEQYFHPTSYSNFDYHSETSWSEEHNDVLEDECSSRCGNRGRTTYTEEQITALEKAFSRNPYPNSQSRQLLSGIIGVPEGKVKIWFQNRRARAKKQKVTPNSWRREGTTSRRSRDSLIKCNASEKLCNESCNNARMKKSSSHHPSTTATAPIPLSNLTINSCNVEKSVSTCAFSSVNFTSPLSSSVENRGLIFENRPNMLYERFDKQLPALRCVYNSYPSRFPIIRKTNFSFSSNSNQNSSNVQFTTSCENVPIMTSFASGAHPTFSSSQAWLNRQANHEKSYLNNHNPVPCTRYVAGNEEASTQLPIFTSASTPDIQIPSTPLSPPPVRRFLFPFQTLLPPVEPLKNSAKFIERKVASDKKCKTTKNPYNQPSSGNCFESPAFHQADITADFNLHGMDYRHELLRSHFSREFETVQKSPIFSGASQVRVSTVSAPLEDRNDKNGVSSSSSNCNVAENEADTHWTSENVALANYFDTSTVLQNEHPPNLQSLETNCYTSSNTKSSSWKLCTGASSAHVIG